MANIQQLLRETNPPPGQPRSPVPQIYDDATGAPATARGLHGVQGAVLYGPDGQPLSTVPVTLTGTPEVTLTGTPEVTLTGTPEVTLTGTSVPLRGLASERPAASAANKGYVYWSLDTGDVSVSTGTTWRSLGVA